MKRLACLVLGHVKRGRYGFGDPETFRCSRCGRGFVASDRHRDLSQRYVRSTK